MSISILNVPKNVRDKAETDSIAQTQKQLINKLAIKTFKVFKSLYFVVKAYFYCANEYFIKETVIGAVVSVRCFTGRPFFF